MVVVDLVNGIVIIYDVVRYFGVYMVVVILLKKCDKVISLIFYVISIILKVGKMLKMVRFKIKFFLLSKGMEFFGGGGFGGLKNLKKCKKFYWNF